MRNHGAGGGNHMKGVKSKIEVEPLSATRFKIRVIEGTTETSHWVTINMADYERLTGKKVEPVELVRRAFEFLLAREPKESILTDFDLSTIGRYFAEFERVMKRDLAGI
jgi:hypothetical protein